MMKFFALKESPLIKSEILMDEILDSLKESQINAIEKHFCCFDVINAMSEKQTNLHRRIRNASPHSIYINFGCRLALCFRHIIPPLIYGYQKLVHFF